MEMKIELLDRSHDRDEFDCVIMELNAFLKKYAFQNQRNNINKTFVAVESGGIEQSDKKNVLGFYTLSTLRFCISRGNRVNACSTHEDVGKIVKSDMHFVVHVPRVVVSVCTPLHYPPAPFSSGDKKILRHWHVQQAIRKVRLSLVETSLIKFDLVALRRVVL